MTRRDQRRVDVLVGRLLADDVLVAQRERDLLDRVVGRAARGSSTATITSARPATSISRRRRTCMRRARRRPGGPRAGRSAGGRRLSAHGSGRSASQEPPTAPAPVRANCRSSLQRRWPVAAFSACVSWRAVRSSSASWPRAPRPLGADRLVGHDRDRRVVVALQARPRTAAGSPPRAPRRRVAADSASRHSATRAPTRGQSRPSSQCRSSSVAKAWRATAERSTRPSGATSLPQRATTAARTSGSS